MQLAKARVPTKRALVAVTGLGPGRPGRRRPRRGLGGRARRELHGAGHPGPDGLPVAFSCRVPELDAAGRLGHRPARRLDRFTPFALLAARQAVADARLAPDGWDGAHVGVVTGVGTGSMQGWQAERQRIAARRETTP
ncbi:beta-ketoacyl synthase N-terminal-like domain-containing protein [Streptomyces sp. NPDC002676]